MASPKRDNDAALLLPSTDPTVIGNGNRRQSTLSGVSTPTNANRKKNSRYEEEKKEDKEHDDKGKKQGLFVDPSQMKEQLRENMRKERYDVRNYYKTEGIIQEVARHQMFENITLAVIGLNALWISIDTDNNNSDTLATADAIFVVMENLFTIFFLGEILIRFAAFQRKTNCMKDAWFVFDTFMVSLMIFETWIMFIIVKSSGGGGQMAIKPGLLKIIRLLRLSRMLRMARLLRAFPELLILIKGFVASVRSVFFTLILLILFIYVFAIYFVQMSKDIPELQETYFSSVAHAQHCLLVHGVFFDNLGNIVWDMDNPEHGFAYHLLFPFYLFLLFATLTVLNMLTGVVCEVVSSTASVEHEKITMDFTKDMLKDIIIDHENNKLKQDNPEAEDYVFDPSEYKVGKEDFVELFKLKDVAELLKEVEVDVFAFVDLLDTIFQTEDGEERKLEFADLVGVLLEQRKTNSATVKDLTDMRKYIKKKFDQGHESSLSLADNKIPSLIINEARFDVMGRMVKKLVNDGDTFETRVKAATKQLEKEEKARDDRLKEELRKQQEELRSRGDALLDEQEQDEQERARAKGLKSQKTLGAGLMGKVASITAKAPKAQEKE